MVAEQFAAFSQCPKCHVHGYHWMRPPRVASKAVRDRYARDMERWQEHYAAWMADGGSETVLRDFSGRMLATFRPFCEPEPKPPRDESAFQVMRECRNCGKEWGQT